MPDDVTANQMTSRSRKERSSNTFSRKMQLTFWNTMNFYVQSSPYFSNDFFLSPIPVLDSANYIIIGVFQCLMQNAGQHYGQGGASSHQGATYGHTESSVSTKKSLREYRRCVGGEVRVNSWWIANKATSWLKLRVLSGCFWKGDKTAILLRTIENQMEVW